MENTNRIVTVFVFFLVGVFSTILFGCNAVKGKESVDVEDSGINEESSVEDSISSYQSNLKNIQPVSTTLENGVKLITLTDPSVEIARVAMYVKGVGKYTHKGIFFSEPHFLEHFIFNNVAYSVNSDELIESLEVEGVDAEARVIDQHTHYAISFPVRRFTEATEKFLKLFSHNLLSEEYLHEDVLSEIDLIGDEALYKTSYSDIYFHSIIEGRKSEKSQVDNHLVSLNPDYYKADAKSLSDSIRRIYRQFYTAPNMTLVIVSPYVQEDVLASLRGGILAIDRNKSQKVDEENSSEEPSPRGKIYEVIKKGRGNSVFIDYFLDEKSDKWSDIACVYLEQLVNSNHKNGLIDSLKKSGAQNVRADCRANYYGDSVSTTFTVGLNIPSSYWGRRHQVVAKISAYLERLKSEGLRENLFDVVQSLAQVRAAGEIRLNLSKYWMARLALIYEDIPLDDRMGLSILKADFNRERLNEAVDGLNLSRAKVYFTIGDNNEEDLGENALASYEVEDLDIAKYTIMAATVSGLVLPPIEVMEKKRDEARHALDKKTTKSRKYFLNAQKKPILLEENGVTLKLWEVDSVDRAGSDGGSISLYFPSNQKKDTAKRKLVSTVIQDLMAQKVKELDVKYGNIKVMGTGGIVLEIDKGKDFVSMDYLKTVVSTVTDLQIDGSTLDKVREHKRRYVYGRSLSQSMPFVIFGSRSLSRAFSRSEVQSSYDSLSVEDIRSQYSKMTKGSQVLGYVTRSDLKIEVEKYGARYVESNGESDRTSLSGLWYDSIGGGAYHACYESDLDSYARYLFEPDRTLESLASLQVLEPFLRYFFKKGIRFDGKFAYFTDLDVKFDHGVTIFQIGTRSSFTSPIEISDAVDAFERGFASYLEKLPGGKIQRVVDRLKKSYRSAKRPAGTGAMDYTEFFYHNPSIGFHGVMLNNLRSVDKQSLVRFYKRFTGLSGQANTKGVVKGAAKKTHVHIYSKRSYLNAIEESGGLDSIPSKDFPCEKNVSEAGASKH